VKSWDLSGIDVAMGKPEVLHSVPQGRAIAIQLDAGRALDDHEVHEGAWLIVVSGRIRASSGDVGTELGAGSMATFEPGERHEVTAIDASRLLLLLSPWPAPDRRMDGAG
jgi:quercetin dioxygenase-like cupin family protein